MAFFDVLPYEPVLASGFQSASEVKKAYTLPPERGELRNVYFKEAIPKYKRGSLRVVGDSVIDGGVVDGNQLLWNTGCKEYSNGSILVVRAADLYPEIGYHKDWKCLRIFQGFENDERVIITCREKGKLSTEAADICSILGRAVYCFEI